MPQASEGDWGRSLSIWKQKGNPGFAERGGNSSVSSIDPQSEVKPWLKSHRDCQYYKVQKVHLIQIFHLRNDHLLT